MRVFQLQFHWMAERMTRRTCIITNAFSCILILSCILMSSHPPAQILGFKLQFHQMAECMGSAPPPAGPAIFQIAAKFVDVSSYCFACIS